jgi:hypothetical protein
VQGFGDVGGRAAVQVRHAVTSGVDLRAALVGGPVVLGAGVGQARQQPAAGLVRVSYGVWFVAWAMAWTCSVFCRSVVSSSPAMVWARAGSIRFVGRGGQQVGAGADRPGVVHQVRGAAGRYVRDAGHFGVHRLVGQAAVVGVGGGHPGPHRGQSPGPCGAQGPLRGVDHVVDPDRCDVQGTRVRHTDVTR